MTPPVSSSTLEAPVADTLTFGTDGWRDIIADRFTFANVGRAAQSYANYLKTQGASLALVGYDTRFNGLLFARHAAQVLVANGIEARLSKGYIPTPALSFAVKHYGAAGGIMLTASHNPPQWHGFKLKGAYGGTATTDIYRAAAADVPKITAQQVQHHDSKIATFDVCEAYYAHISTLVDLDTIRAFKGTIAHEAMGGAGTGWLTGLFAHIGMEHALKEIHPEPSPLFYGTNPEPIALNLTAARQWLTSEEVAFVTATDGDGDRLGVVLPDGTFFNSHQIFAVLLAHLAAQGRTGQVVKTFTVSRVIERLAAQHGLPVAETPVGFKYIVDAMLADDVLIGGEESGGIGVAGHIPERDGIANTLLLLEAMITAQKPLKEIFSTLEKQVEWHHAYDRVDLHVKGNTLKDAVMEALNDPPTTFAGRTLESVETRDGVKLNLSGQAWLIFRPSGTEPVLRMYCEAATDTEVKQVLEAAQAFITRFS